jgi:hypothetical protein
MMIFASHNALKESRDAFSGNSMNDQALTWILFFRGRCMGSGSANIRFWLRLLTCGKENTNISGDLSGCTIRKGNSGRIWITLGTGGNMHFVHSVKFKRNFVCLLNVGSLEFVVSSKQRDVEPRTL